MHFWINTVSRNHVMQGVEGGFTQADHGKDTRLRQLNEGDWLVFYSPREAYPDGQALQAFTALGRVGAGAVYQVEMREDFHPWRKPVQFLAAREAPIRPLIDSLSFITDKRRWGFPFRRGLFEISQADFALIAAEMAVAIEESDTDAKD